MSWQLGSTLIVAAVVAAGLAWYELRRPPAKLVALVAALAALAVAGRVLFAAIPNVQATTDVALLSGYALGPAPGFVVGAIAALASNVFLGQGPWTPWEMLGWGAAGLFGAALAGVSARRLGRVPLALACGVAGFLFGAWMDLFTLVAFTSGSAQGYLAISAVSLPFNIAHAAGNVLLCLAFGPAFVRMLVRFRRRMSIHWRTATVTAAISILALAALTIAAPVAFAGSRDAVRYLERAQNRDGGFGPTLSTPSSQLMTGWAVLGLEAGGRNPLDLRSGGPNAVGYMRSGAAQLRDTGELERTILALRGAGVSARRFAGRDLVAELLGRRRSDGSWQRLSNLTSFAVLALRASGRSARSAAVREAAAWLVREQNHDGGFSLGTGGGGSFIDETGAALQALGAAGRGGGKAAARAVSFLRKAQNPDGGYGQSPGQRSNAQSTAWAVQGLVAAGANPRRGRVGVRSPIRFLTSLQQPDGSFRYSRTSKQTPVWVSAQALAAVRLAAFPIGPQPRRKAARAAGTKAPAAAGRTARRAVARAKHPRRRALPAGQKAVPVRPQVAVRPAANVSPRPREERGGGGPGVAVLIALGAAALGVCVALARRLRAP